MEGVYLAIPEEPKQLVRGARGYLATTPCEGIRWIEEADWIVDYLWPIWGPTLADHGMRRKSLTRITQGYSNELRLWVAGERTWQHCVEGLIGRIVRRLEPTSNV